MSLQTRNLMLVARNASSAEEHDRFAPPRLSPAGRHWIRVGGRKARPETGGPAGPLLRPLRIFDRALLLIELACALVVAWLVWQYIYTVYFDTGARRPLLTRIGAVVGPAHTQTPTFVSTATPTRVAELVPPLVGGPDPDRVGAGGGRQGNTMGNRDGGNGTDSQAVASPIPAPTLAPISTSTPVPTPTPTISPQLLLPRRLRIPVMFLDSPVEEVHMNMGTWEVSPMLVGHHAGSGNPGQTGNVVLAAHRDINSALFRDLDRLRPGDEVFVSNGLGEYRYTVTESFVVTPDRTEVMAPTTDRRVTLITCTPVGLATQRLIVVATMDAPGDRH